MACPYGALVNAGGEDGAKLADVHHRFFAPWAGIDEDPVTGSAHCVLAPHFARKLQRHGMRTRQCSRRGGEVGMSWDEQRGTCCVRGAAVTTVVGAVLLPVKTES